MEHNGLTVTTPSDRELALARVFDAPRELVFEALTRPDLLKRWLGAEGFPLEVCEVDLRPGGRYRYVWRGAEYGEMGMGGEIREVSPQRLVMTEEWDQPWYAGEGLVTFDMADEDGGTRLTLIVRYDTRETRDEILASQMKEGMSERFEALAQVLASLQERG